MLVQHWIDAIARHVLPFLTKRKILATKYPTVRAADGQRNAVADRKGAKPRRTRENTNRFDGFYERHLGLLEPKRCQPEVDETKSPIGLRHDLYIAFRQLFGEVVPKRINDLFCVQIGQHQLPNREPIF